MQPSERALRDVLRREAAQVRTPDDMWANISRRLADSQPAPEPTPWLLHFWQQGRSVIALAAAAALFWIMPTPWHMAGEQAAAPKPLPAVAMAPTARQGIAKRNIPIDESVAAQGQRQSTRQNQSEPPHRSNPFQVNTPR